MRTTLWKTSKKLTGKGRSGIRTSMSQKCRWTRVSIICWWDQIKLFTTEVGHLPIWGMQTGNETVRTWMLTVVVLTLMEPLDKDRRGTSTLRKTSFVTFLLNLGQGIRTSTMGTTSIWTITEGPMTRTVPQTLKTRSSWGPCQCLVRSISAALSDLNETLSSLWNFIFIIIMHKLYTSPSALLSS